MPVYSICRANHQKCDRQSAPCANCANNSLPCDRPAYSQSGKHKKKVARTANTPRDLLPKPQNPPTVMVDLLEAVFNESIPGFPLINEAADISLGFYLVSSLENRAADIKGMGLEFNLASGPVANENIHTGIIRNNADKHYMDRKGILADAAACFKGDGGILARLLIRSSPKVILKIYDCAKPTLEGHWGRKYPDIESYDDIKNRPLLDLINLTWIIVQKINEELESGPLDLTKSDKFGKQIEDLLLGKYANVVELAKSQISPRDRELGNAD
ncbi:hypothetical protein F5882DRAFT_385396 [Hyaloscypha sp. PMI_1271]|nr:hypothetical protein F5882DRAFT_385396 [Hyaloscypha sp. PMI_1271]